MVVEASRKARSHRRILEIAGRAIRRSGYRGVRVAEIMKEAGLTHGGFYSHFESREALLYEAMGRAEADASEALERRIEQRLDRGEGAFTALVNAYLDDTQLVEVELGCEVASLASDMSREQGTVRERARRQVLNLITRVADALDRTDGHRVRAIAGTLVGSLQLARALGGCEGQLVLKETRLSLLSLVASRRHP